MLKSKTTDHCNYRKKIHEKIDISNLKDSCNISSPSNNLRISFLYTEIDECESTPCQNGGTCVDALDSYTCTCVVGYTGLSCEAGTC